MGMRAPKPPPFRTQEMFDSRVLVELTNRRDVDEVSLAGCPRAALRHTRGMLDRQLRPRYDGTSVAEYIDTVRDLCDLGDS